MWSSSVGFESAGSWEEPNWEKTRLRFKADFFFLFFSAFHSVLSSYMVFSTFSKNSVFPRRMINEGDGWRGFYSNLNE